MQARHFFIVILAYVSCILLLISDGEARQQHAEFSSIISQDILREKRMIHQDDMNQPGNNTIPDDHFKRNEIDDRITIGEPYKSLFQTTARFALAQTKITKHVNIDTAMNFLNDASYFLAKPVVLFKVLKVLAVSLATFMATIFFFPGAYQFIDAAWKDPVNTLNFDRYLTNGMHERSVIGLLGSKTDETLSRVGLQDNSCRERSICYVGEIIKCSFPHTSETITKFASENFSNTGIRENVYARAFVSGFVDRNCSRIGFNDAQENQNCLSNFINSILMGSENSRNRPRN